MAKNSVDIKKIMTEIKKKAHGAGYSDDLLGFDTVSEELTEKQRIAVMEDQLRADIETVNRQYHAGYDSSVDIGSPIRAKLGSMIRVRLTPIIDKRNIWSASVVRILNQLNSGFADIKSIIDESDPQLLKNQVNELELKLYMAMKQMEVMNSRITELEKALEKKGEEE